MHSSISQHLDEIKKTLKPGVTLVAVSKTHPMNALMEAYDAGQRIFGENRVQELLAKHDLGPADIQWHLIGQLQRNKVKQIIPCVSLIHSVDSLKLLETIQEEASKIKKNVSVLLQVHIAEEKTKSGFIREDLWQLLQDSKLQNYSHIRICGLMGMATFTDDQEIVRQEFKGLKIFYDQLKNQFFKESDSFQHLSMGMTGDYLLAIEEGANMVRIGSAIFGHR